MRRLLPLCALLAACVGGQTGTPASGDGEDDVPCVVGLDTPTALGLTSADLLELYAGTYAVPMKRRRIQGGQPFPEVSVELTIAPSQRPFDEEDCRVSVPVDISLRGPDLDLRLTGTLVGSLDVGIVEFFDSRGATLTSGRVSFVDRRLSVNLTVAGVAWSTGEP